MAKKPKEIDLEKLLKRVREINSLISSLHADAIDLETKIVFSIWPVEKKKKKPRRDRHAVGDSDG